MLQENKTNAQRFENKAGLESHRRESDPYFLGAPKKFRAGVETVGRVEKMRGTDAMT